MNALRTIWLRLPDSVRAGLTLFLIARIAFWLWGGIVMTLLPPVPQVSILNPIALLPPSPAGWLLNPWLRWDVGWYIRIAVEGYIVADGRAAFGPILPLLISLLGSALGGQHIIAAFVISDLACLGSLILLYEIAQRDGYLGRRALAALLLFPFVFFMFVPYTESMLLLLTLAAFLAARDGRWWLAGLCGGLAVLTKVTALVLLLPLAWEVWEYRRSRFLSNSLWLAVLPLAAAGWILVRSVVFGTSTGLDGSSAYGLLTPLLSSDYAAMWNVSPSWPWDSLMAAVRVPIQRWPHLHAVIALIDLVVGGMVVYLGALTFRLSRKSYPIYTVAVLVLSLILIVPYLPLQDAPRRWMMAFPLFIAATCVPRKWDRLLFTLSLLLQAFLSLLFVKWLVVG